MNSLKKSLYRYLLERFLANGCAARIPRSGLDGQKVNCYVVTLEHDNSPPFMATEIEGDMITGLKYDGHMYSYEETIPIEELDRCNLSIRHFYGLDDVIYSGIYGAAFHYFTRFIYIKIRLRRLIESIDQHFFNKRKLVTKNRIDLLQFMMNDQLDRTHDRIGAVSLMAKIYSAKLFLHPAFGAQKNKLEFYLSSLVESGDLSKMDNQYTVTAKAIETIEKYEEEERRHTEAVKLQRKMFYLALIATFFAIVESGVIKLPTIINLSTTSKASISTAEHP